MSRGGGAIEPGTQFLSENGFALLYIEASCRFWARRTRWDPVVTGTFDSAARAKLETLLRLDRFASYAGEYQTSVCDAPTFTYAYGAAKVSVRALCNTGVDDSAPVAWLLDAFKQALELAVDAGEPWQGAVRYVLIDDAGSGLNYRGAPRWPLAAGHEKAYTVEEADQLAPGSSTLVQDTTEAMALRALWNDWRGSMDAGTATTPFIQVLGAAGEQLQLYVRDAIPLEGPDGLLALP